jgi:N-acetylneuraminic acid mutarotase
VIGVLAASHCGSREVGGLSDAAAALEANAEVGGPDGNVIPATCDGGTCTSGPLVLFGGDNNFGSFLGDTWTFDGTSFTQVPVSNPPLARYASSIASLGNEVVLFGGMGRTMSAAVPTDLRDTWTFNGTSWTQASVPAANSPPPRDLTAMAALGNEVVLFAGASATLLDDTWTFNGTSWTQLSVSNPPPPRRLGMMATLGNVVVLFGGQGNSGDLNDTWTFDGTSWTQLSISNPPPARNGAMMATRGNEIVLFGGNGSLSGSADYLGDTWVFDGTSWNQVFVSPTPPARDLAVMAALGNVVVLFGGEDTSGELNDTWTFDGSNWTQLSVSNPPPVRILAVMAPLR